WRRSRRAARRSGRWPGDTTRTARAGTTSPTSCARRRCRTSLVGEDARTAGRDHAGVHAHPVEPAEQAGMLDLHAAVHDRVEARLARHRVGALVDHAQLLPEAAGAGIDRLPRDRLDIGGTPEDV